MCSPRLLALPRLAALAALAACSPRISLAYDASARQSGPLSTLGNIARVTAFTGVTVPPPPDGKTLGLGLGFGTHWLTIGGRVFANGVSGAMLDAFSGPQYMSGGAAIDVRGALELVGGLSLSLTLAPTRTVLLDTMSGGVTWGNGVRYGGGVSYALWMFSVYADVFQEQLWFSDGPAQGNSTRTGLTVGVAFQP